jgi:multisubunit Na+/H+ antiporter MnhB subunit
MSRLQARSLAALRIVTLVASTGLAAALALAMLELPVPPIRLAAAVQAQLGASGVSHPVTAVLLNFRAYDTLLEVAVLLLAALGVLALHPACGDTAPSSDAAANPVLGGLLNLLVPLMLVLAGYLVWVGAHGPGGAFQAGAVLAATGVLLRLSGRWMPVLPPRATARAGLLVGLLTFLAVATGTWLAGGAMLEFPSARAGALILGVEIALTVSIGLTLLCLFIGAPAPRR